MRRAAAVLALLLLCLVAPACDGGDPTPSDLFGIWGNLDAGQWRVFEFSASCTDHAELAGLSPVYSISLYAEGAAPLSVQRGTYAIKFGRLVTTVIYDANPGNIGQTFGNDIRDVGATSFELESTATASGTRLFSRRSAYP
jgi:hypothetical protein